ncbi:MAG: gephyrin-like molybdotransferase Glp [Candidatus Tectimicrobiota bacterium]
MLTYSQALRLLLQTLQPGASEEIPLTEAYGRFAAQPLRAPNALPPFHQSMVDGYALRSSDTRTASSSRPLRLQLGRTLTAGTHQSQALAPQQAVRIMTGAPLPGGADTVLKIEDSETEAECLIVRQPLRSGAFLQRRGAEIQARTLVLKAGERLTPQRIGVALALGLASAAVYRRPRVALVAPGDELLPPGAPLQPGKKWCSNLYALEIRLQELGCQCLNLGIVPDTLASLTTQLQAGLAADIVVILGASGRGDHDFARHAMAAIGATTLFQGVATSPGRSITVSQRDRTLFIGLPGSPWAAFVGFETFVLPALRALCGQRPAMPERQPVTLATPVNVRPGVTHFLPVRLQWQATGVFATPVESLLTLARTESGPLGLLIVPPHRRTLAPGSRTQVQPIAL